MTIKNHEHDWRDLSEHLGRREIFQWGGWPLQTRLETPYLINGFCLDKECDATRVEVLQDGTYAIIDWEALHEESDLYFLPKDATIHPL